MSKLAKALTAAAGNAGGANLYVEDVFSTYLYEGNGSTQTITNGIDLNGEGGLVWTKKRNSASDGNHILFDTERVSGVNDYWLSTNNTTAQLGGGSYIDYNSDGFHWTFGSSSWNSSGNTFASWTFRKAEKFFDVVTYTGDGVAGRTVAHNLGSTPAFIAVKRTNTSGNDWQVYHKDAGGLLHLNTTAAANSGNLQYAFGNDSIAIAPTSSVFTISSQDAVNNNGSTYVAYLFASDAGGFGDDGSESIIKCGSYTGTGVAGLEINLGFEPQWLLIKNANDISNWNIYDVMRGITVGGTDYQLEPNTSDAELGYSNWFDLTATGFKVQTVATAVNGSGNNIIYIAIRRPMKTPESGTEVFAIDTLGGTAPNPPGFNGVLVDWAWKRVRNTGDDWYSQSRLTGTNAMKLNVTDTESSVFNILFDYQDGWLDSSATLSTQLSWMFKRAPGFFDVVTYTGNNTYGRTVTHGLGVVPEMIIVKARNKLEGWPVYHAGIAADAETDVIFLQSDAPFGDNANYWADTKPTATNFTLGQDGSVNDNSAYNYIAYLFASVDGVSKVGSYTGTGSNVDVDCGFSVGARFILIKRTDSTGDWYVWNSVRGIVAGNDPYLLINSTAPEVTSTDYIDPLASGFTVTSSAPAALNASGGNYIFLAIA